MPVVAMVVDSPIRRTGHFRDARPPRTVRLSALCDSARAERGGLLAGCVGASVRDGKADDALEAKGSFAWLGQEFEIGVRSTLMFVVRGVLVRP